VKTLSYIFLLLCVSSTASAEWESYLGVDQKGSSREGFAFSNWTDLSPSLNWPDDKIEAALVAGCNDKGEKSLYIRILPRYPARDSENQIELVEGKIQWDSSYSYSAPFTYDESLNALHLRFGLEDTLALINDGNNVTIQIPWYDEHKAVFKFSLTGSSEALKAAFDYCLVGSQAS